MSILHIEIRMENAAFEGWTAGHEVARILRRLANDCSDMGTVGRIARGFILQDANGNCVGSVRVEP